MATHGISYQQSLWSRTPRHIKSVLKMFLPLLSEPRIIISVKLNVKVMHYDNH